MGAQREVLKSLICVCFRFFFQIMDERGGVRKIDMTQGL